MIAGRGEQHCGDQRLGQFLGRDDHRPSLTIVEDMLVIAGGVGGVGRDGDAARGHDCKIGDQPFGAVLADQHDPVAGVHPEPFQAIGKRSNLARGLGPTDRLPRARRLRPQERRIAFVPCAGEEHRHQIGKMFELLFQNPLPAGQSSPTTPVSCRRFSRSGCNRQRRERAWTLCESCDRQRACRLPLALCCLPRSR